MTQLQERAPKHEETAVPLLASAVAGDGADRAKARSRSIIIETMHATGTQTDVKALIHEGAERTDRALERLLPPVTQVPASIHGAMRHSVFAGGKRLRPVLAMEAARAIRAAHRATGLPDGIEELGAAIEMLHTYSLIHDDLPALDNDDLRRGKPTCHVAFGEAIAILAGDALQTLAYQALAGLRCAPDRAIRIVGLIAEATGTVEGMIGGQVLDLEGEHSKPTAETVLAIHRAKTGALIRVSIVAGGIYAGADADAVRRLTDFGTKAGLAFQIVDDVLDMTQDSEHLGKTAGKDLASDKATWPAVFGIEQSRQDASRLIAEAFAVLEPYGEAAESLKAVAKYLVERTH
jgi:geranylgeranyl diphosphate synthase, type II